MFYTFSLWYNSHAVYLVREIAFFSLYLISEKFPPVLKKEGTYETYIAAADAVPGVAARRLSSSRHGGVRRRRCAGTGRYGPRAMGCRSAGSHTGSGGTAGVYGDSGRRRPLAHIGKSFAGVWPVQGRCQEGDVLAATAAGKGWIRLMEGYAGGATPACAAK